MNCFLTLFVSSALFISTFALADQTDLVSCDVYFHKLNKQSTVTVEDNYSLEIKVDEEKTLSILYFAGNRIDLELTREPTRQEFEDFKKENESNKTALAAINIAAASTKFIGTLEVAYLSSEDVAVSCERKIKLNK